jgi:CDP-glycerol glycerophosphotransferase (TagB/SpsB family)
MIHKIEPDYIFSVTPYLIEEEFLLRASSLRNIKRIASILSFDNITTRPHLPVHFDKYLVWNKYNRQELLRIYSDIHPKDIELVGAPQFDFYYDTTYLWSEQQWRERLGIPESRPVILFGAGYYSIAPVEPHVIAQLDRAIQEGIFPNQPVILLRLHPVDPPARWEQLKQSARNVIFDKPWEARPEALGKTNVARYDIEKLASTLKWSQIHVSTSSTMTIDGAIYDRPQIGPAYDDQPGRIYDRAMRELYLREHYLPITRSGGIQIAYSFDELLRYIAEGFENPQQYSKERKNMVRDLCAYIEGKSTERIAKTIREFIGT